MSKKLYILNRKGALLVSPEILEDTILMGSFTDIDSYLQLRESKGWDITMPVADLASLSNKVFYELSRAYLLSPSTSGEEAVIYITKGENRPIVRVGNKSIIAALGTGTKWKVVKSLSDAIKYLLVTCDNIPVDTVSDTCLTLVKYWKHEDYAHHIATELAKHKDLHAMLAFKLAMVEYQEGGNVSVQND